MFGPCHSNRPLYQQAQPGNNADDMPGSLLEACDALANALSEFAAQQAVLDGELPAGAEEVVAAVVDTAWFARQACDRLATAILKATPKTAAETVARWDALAAYSALPDADELMKSLLSDTTLAAVGAPLPPAASGSHPLLQVSSWKAWLRAGRSPDVPQPASGRLIEGHRDPPR